MNELADQIEALQREEDYERHWDLLGPFVFVGGPRIWPWVERLTTSESDLDRWIGFQLAAHTPHYEDEASRAWARKVQLPTADVPGFNPEQLAELERRACDALATATDADVINAAMHAAQEQWLPAALPGILSHADHPDRDVRHSVALALDMLELEGKSEAAIAALVKLARDPDDDVRDWALFALGRPWQEPIDTPATRAVFRENLGHEHDGVSWEAMSALALLGDVEQLLEIFEYEDVDNEFVEKAAEVGDPRLHPALVEMRDDGWAADDDPEMATYREGLLVKALAATS